MSNFSNWIKWEARNSIGDIFMPGVYIVALDREIDLHNRPFSWKKEIIYIGMTNSKGGLKNRLNQFNYTIKNNGIGNHGGGQRVKFKHNNYNKLIKNLYVSIVSFKTDLKQDNVEDLLVMGDVAKFEYTCLAEYLKRYKCLPEFNDKDKSPKKNIKQPPNCEYPLRR